MGCARFVRGRWSFCIAFAIVALAMRQQAIAQTWDGGGTTDNWSNAINWNLNVIPVNNGTADIILAGTTRLTPNVDLAWNIKSLIIDATAGTFVMGGSQLTIQAGGITVSDAIFTSDATINNAILLGADQTWNTTVASADLIVNGAINTNAHLLTTSTIGDMTLAGIISGTGGIQKTNTGITTLSGAAANTYTGVTTVSAGTLQLGKSVANGAIVGNLVIGDGVGSVLGDVVKLTASNQISEAAGNTVTINSSGQLFLQGFTETIQNLTLNGGVVSMNVGGHMTLLGNLTINPSTFSAAIGGGTLDLNGINRVITVPDQPGIDDFVITANTSNGSFTKVGPGQLVLAGTNTTAGIVVNEGTIILSGGTPIPGAVIIGDGIGGAAADIVQLRANSTINTLAGNSMLINSSGRLDLNGFSAGVRDIPLDGSSITTGAGSLAPAGTLTTLASATTATISGHVDAASPYTMTLARGTAPVDLDISADMTGSFSKDGPGILRLSGSNNITGSVTMNAGTLLAASPNALKIGTIVLNGAVLQADGAARATAAALIVGTTSTIDGPFDLSVGGTVSLSGVLIKNGSGALTLSGSIQGSSAGLTLNGAGLVTLAGATANTYAGDTTVNAGTLSLAKTNNAASIVGSLVIGANAAPPGSVVVRLDTAAQLAIPTNKSLTVNSSGLLDLNGFNASLADLRLAGGAVTPGRSIPPSRRARSMPPISRAWMT